MTRDQSHRPLWNARRAIRYARAAASEGDVVRRMSYRIARTRRRRTNIWPAKKTVVRIHRTWPTRRTGSTSANKLTPPQTVIAAKNTRKIQNPQRESPTSRRIVLAKSDGTMRKPLVGCSCQADTRLSGARSDGISSSLIHVLTQEFLHPAHPGRHVARGDARHLRDLRRAQTLEVQNDELPVQRPQPLNQLHQAREQHAPVGVRFDSDVPDIEVIESDQRPRAPAPFVHHMRRRHVVGDAINPCAQRALTIEPIEAPPEIQVDVLEQVLTLVCVELV